MLTMGIPGPPAGVGPAGTTLPLAEMGWQMGGKTRKIWNTRTRERPGTLALSPDSQEILPS